MSNPFIGENAAVPAETNTERPRRPTIELDIVDGVEAMIQQ